MQTIKQAYADAMNGLGAGLTSRGILSREPTTARGDLARWLHSLFAIYDIDGMIALDLPWWTLRAARLIDRFLRNRPGATVFEYGAGGSTVFLAKRAGIVISAEHDPQWHALVAKKVKTHPNVLMTLAEAGPGSSSGDFASGHAAWRGFDFRDYVKAIDRFEGSFDLVVIDGRCRNRCLEKAIQRVKPDGVILFDNAGRKRYRVALEACSLPKLEARGLTACLPYPDPTILLSPAPTTIQRLLDAE